MSSLRLHQVTVTVADRPLFERLTLHFPPGWTGLVGPNGSGKTTLLEVLARTRRVDEGHVEWEPTGLSLCLVPQRTEGLSDDVLALEQATDGAAAAWRARLGLVTEPLSERWPTLSHGERKRWQCAAALWREPAVLLLDEPTNHVDVETSELLLAALERFRGVGVIVSHDRATLDRLTRRTVELAKGRARLSPLPWTAARETWRAEDEQRRRAHRAMGRELERLAAAHVSSRDAHQSATRERSAGRRMKSRSDSDARGVGANFRAERAQAHLSQAQQRLAVERERLRERQRHLDVDFDEGLPPLQLTGAPSPKEVVCRLEAGGVPRQRPIALVEAPLLVHRRERLGLVGRNGAGKSTLLEALRGAATVPPEHVLWMPQELTEAQTMASLDELLALERGERGRGLQWLSALGVDPEHLLRSRRPSAGEARLLHLSLALPRTPWLLLLDEPTNHLSIELVERLERALATLDTAIVVVSHDLRFLDAIGAQRLRLVSGPGVPSTLSREGGNGGA